MMILKSDITQLIKIKVLNSEQKGRQKDLNNEKLNEFGKKIDPEFDVYREIRGNPYTSFCKLLKIILHKKITSLF